ncbi:hypothetical protein N1851_005988 [Merluccius polli]|uniref:C2H2-type domain-containing protein n=1 Tax=Merluccius polli TaxID=89951 RepID=A0AA47P8S8_MERPO|nr:hypothetical protein N1851_005988 [Merluccius polli]
MSERILQTETPKQRLKKKTQLSCFQCPTMFDTVQEMAVHMKTHCEQDLGHHRCDMCYKVVQPGVLC